MKPWIEKILLMLIYQIITPGAMKEFKEDFIKWLREVVKRTPTKLDDAGVELLAQFLGVK